MSGDVAVSLRRVTKQVGRKTIIDDLSFEARQGEIFGLLGPNGAGKTTTIRMMVGLMSMTRGDILIRGKSVKTEFEEAIRHVGAIVENPEMYKYLSGYRNLIHYARMSTGVTKTRIDEVVSLVKLEQRIHDKVKRYSLGMRQRLGVAQALLHRPSVLILDEPTNGLDPAGIREMRDYLRTLTREEGITVIVSSHLLSEMEMMCDRVAVIQQGKLVDVKPVSDYLEAGDAPATYVIEAVPGDAALAAVRQVEGILAARPVPRGIEVVAARELVPELIACLVRNQVSVYGVHAERRSLEDRFLEMTGAGQIG